jgi:hypothetical protein
VKVWSAREASAPAPIPPRRTRRNRAREKGGEIVDPALSPATDQDPAISGPLFSVEAFRKIVADEFGRFYVPEEGVERDWKPIVGILEDMRRTADSAGVRFLVVLYPSQLQISRDFRREMLVSVTALRGYRGLAEARIDPQAPNRYLLDWCQRSGVNCFDLTAYLSQEAHQESRPLYIARDSHWNILGNRLAAAGETAFLERELCPGDVDGLAQDPR